MLNSFYLPCLTQCIVSIKINARRVIIKRDNSISSTVSALLRCFLLNDWIRNRNCSTGFSLKINTIWGTPKNVSYCRQYCLTTRVCLVLVDCGNHSIFLGSRQYRERTRMFTNVLSMASLLNFWPSRATKLTKQK